MLNTEYLSISLDRTSVDSSVVTIRIEAYECEMEFTLSEGELKKFHEMIGRELTE